VLFGVGMGGRRGELSFFLNDVAEKRSKWGHKKGRKTMLKKK
jgi:hypothetical protein